MKLLAITFKDLLQSTRSAFSLVFMFGVPILVTGLFYVMFGGGTADQAQSLNLPQTRVLVVNLDEGSPYLGQSEPLGSALVGLLQGDDFSQLLAVSLSNDAAAARAAVDSGDANVALLIPASFSRALIEPQAAAEVELYQDPTLTIGPHPQDRCRALHRAGAGQQGWAGGNPNPHERDWTGIGRRPAAAYCAALLGGRHRRASR